MAVTNSPTKKFIINISGGLIKTESQAMTVLVILCALALALSVFLLYQTFVPPVEPANLPPSMPDTRIP